MEDKTGNTGTITYFREQDFQGTRQQKETSIGNKETWTTWEALTIMQKLVKRLKCWNVQNVVSKQLIIHGSDLDLTKVFTTAVQTLIQIQFEFIIWRS